LTRRLAGSRQPNMLHPSGLTPTDANRKLALCPGEKLGDPHFNGSLCDELLNGEIFYSLAEARVLIEAWRRHYNTVRPHSSLGYRPPAPEAVTPPLPASGSASLHLRPAMAAETTMH
ncbi:MAG: transposase, partial [Sphingomonas pseudosanguinis]|uniref:integrase core domain-containing protein n=1 Tax=Sphingomonas pseudosanguinis TaxID=413712 RepID=UPI00391CA585